MVSISYCRNKTKLNTFLNLRRKNQGTDTNTSIQNSSPEVKITHCLMSRAHNLLAIEGLSQLYISNSSCHSMYTFSALNRQALLHICYCLWQLSHDPGLSNILWLYYRQRPQCYSMVSKFSFSPWALQIWVAISIKNALSPLVSHNDRPQLLFMINLTM